MTAARDEATDQSPGWAAPVSVAVLGWGSVPLLFVSPLSFVLGLCLVVGAGLVGLILFTGPSGPWTRKLVAAFGLLGAFTAVCLMVLPFLLQD